VAAYLSGRPNWPTFPRCRTVSRHLKPIRAGQRTHHSFKQQLRSGVLLLNIAAAGVAPACRTKRGTPRPATGGRREAAIAERLPSNNTCFWKGKPDRFRRRGIRHLRGRIPEGFWKGSGGRDRRCRCRPDRRGSQAKPIWTTEGS
jgi:hypothetical protein